MSITIPNFLTEKVVNGLNTYVYTTTSSAMHVARIRIQKLPASNMTIVIKQNSTTLATLVVPTVLADSAQSTAELAATANCTSGDTISFVITSSAVADEQLNTVVATLNVHIGSSN